MMPRDVMRCQMFERNAQTGVVWASEGPAALGLSLTLGGAILAVPLVFHTEASGGDPSFPRSSSSFFFSFFPSSSFSLLLLSLFSFSSCFVFVAVVVAVVAARRRSRGAAG